MSFNPSLPNQYDIGLEDTKIRDQFFKEYIGLTNLSGFMGKADTSPIHIAELQTGAGASYVFSLLRELESGYRVGEFEQLQGNEQDINIFSQTVTTKRERNAVKLQSPDIVRQRSPLKIYEELRPAILRLNRRDLVDDLMREMTVNLYNSADGGTGPLIDRVIYGGKGYQNTVYAGCNAMNAGTFTTDSHTKDGLSVEHIRKLHRYARMGGTTVKRETPLTPPYLKTRKGFPVENYIYLIDPESYSSLVKDPAWSVYHDSARKQSEDLPNGLDGARYRGQIEGVMIYECHELAEYRVNTSNNKVAAWNLLLGGNALGLVWSSRPQIITETWDYQDNIGVGVKEYRGQAALKFPSRQNPAVDIEAGIIHSFVRIS
ncbi:phage capsid family protein [Cysteiniphilum halobium]|uniref:phage capsid family protein n=1 Tax=Cysteiniphilum halobium TaxID=2219059 RepID=UPI003F86F3A3